MAKKGAIAKDCPFSEEEIAEFYDMLYTARMQQHATPVPQEAGTYVRQPITPSMLKGHQRAEEYRREEMSTDAKKASIRAEISRLQAELKALEEEERNNTPHKQLNLFE